jgi:integrase
MSKTYSEKCVHKGGIIRLRDAVYQVEINYAGQRLRKSFKTLKEAKSFINGKKAELTNDGIRALSLTDAHRLDAGRAISHLPPNVSLEQAVKAYKDAVARLDGTPLDQAIEFFLKHTKPVGGTRTVSKLFEEYLAAKIKNDCRPATIRDLTSRLGTFAESFGERLIHTIIAKEIDDWLDRLHYKQQSRLNYIRVLSGLFNYAIKLGLMAENPADKDHLDRPKMDEKLPEIFTVGDVEKLLAAAQKHARRVVPYLAIGFFAGLRTVELDGLDWSCINIEQKLITVRPETAKRRRQRHVDMSDNLIAWLLPYAKSHGPVRPKGARKYLDKAIEQANIIWVQNGMRHSFASNHIAKHQDVAKTSIQLGHTGRVDVLFNHYRNLVTASDTAKYWAITPAG